MPSSSSLLFFLFAAGIMMGRKSMADENYDAIPTLEPTKERSDGDKDWKGGEESCPCLTLEEAGIANLPFFEPPYLYYKDKGELYEFSETYGSEVCAAHDDGNPPYCEENAVGAFPGNPDWCGQPWCWVDPEHCQDARVHPSQFFPDSNLYFSYDTCGGSNTFAAWARSADTTQHSFTDLIGLVERYVVSTKTTLEQQSQRIESFVSTSSPASIAAECTPLPSCADGACPECHDNVGCWNRAVDLESTTTVLSPTKRFAASQDELDTLACQTNTLSRSFLQVAGREYNDNHRIAFAYHGDQNTGALVQWPATADTCDDDNDDYDARFRPWYAAALSGSKDVVLVIDVSGSMKVGQRIQLAAQAAKAVLRTLTWVDYFNIITFNDVVKSVYSSSLQPATEDVLMQAMKWIDQHVVAKGGTNFGDPLKLAYQLLSAAGHDNNDETSRCSQAILFLTDGEDAGFQVSSLDAQREANPHVVTFTYSLGATAATDVLHELACAGNGIFHRVDNAPTLPNVMAAYYEYFVQLQDSCHVTWMKYKGAFTGEDFLSGCVPVFAYSDKEDVLPSVTGVTCLDLNLIVDLETLQSCRSGGFDEFIRVVQQEAQACSSSTQMDPCVLAHLRQRAGSSCSADAASTCTLPPQPMTSDCSNLDPSRFQNIPLSGCSTLGAETTCPPPQGGAGGGGSDTVDNEGEFATEITSTSDSTAVGVLTFLILFCCCGMGVAVTVAVICCCCSSKRGDRRPHAVPVVVQASPVAAVKVEASSVQMADESVRTVPEDLRILPPPTTGTKKEPSIASLPSDLHVLPPPTSPPTDSIRETW